ncbi:MAG TPA: aminodeoxychorismate synthase component I [Labilithrix sp.]|nr:aminodeoxychorismate synthase component I [Labilithrix sp.]
MPQGRVRTLIIDNYDSFTFNLYQLVAVTNGTPPVVVRNNQLRWSELATMGFDNVVISPGPGTPEKPKNLGICRDAILSAIVPTLGVCLGHQGIGHLYGAQVRHAPKPMHGRLSAVFHDESALFEGIPQAFRVVRYHSLVVDDAMPPDLERIAWTADGIVMGLRHRTLPLWGVQFHPESICSEYGDRLLRNFRDLTLQTKRSSSAPFSGARVSVLPSPSAFPAEGSGFRVASRKLVTWADPEGAFTKLFSKEPLAFWLDSSRAETGLSRFSFMGSGGGPLSALVSYRTETRELVVTAGGNVFRTKESIYTYLERELARRGCTSDELPFDFNCGFVGYFGYELKSELGSEFRHVSDSPDAMFLFADRMLVFDHQEREVYLVSLILNDDERAAHVWFDAIERQLIDGVRPEPEPPSGSGPPVAFRLARTREQYLRDVESCRRNIIDGESYELCLTNSIHTDVKDLLSVYRTLRRINPAPYSAFLRFPDVSVASSSPERFLRIDRQRNVESKPIKGTRPRGATPQEDEVFRRALLSNEKDRSENLMIVDLLRNDLGIVCEMGSVHVPKLMAVETYQTVHQLVSTIRGRLQPDQSASACIQNAFPGGSMTGAPKRRSMKILEDIEREPRGVYSGAIGYLGLNGTADLNIVIRTLVQTPQGTTIGVGGAVVALSSAEDEFQETMWKARALVHAVVLTERGSIEPEAFESAMAELRDTGKTVV